MEGIRPVSVPMPLSRGKIAKTRLLSYQCGVPAGMTPFALATRLVVSLVAHAVMGPTPWHLGPWSRSVASAAPPEVAAHGDLLRIYGIANSLANLVPEKCNVIE